MSLAARITAAGISAPTFEDILEFLKQRFRSIYGSDIYIEPDSQDGQMINIFATEVQDANNMAIATYNSFSPATAQGVGLSSVVKINGIRRAVPSNSQTPVLCVGAPGTEIGTLLIGDNLNLNTQWRIAGAALADVVIPDAGEITTTATCITPGAISAVAGSLTVILNPTRGWQTVNNPADAAEGLPVESDADLRRRQAQSTSLPALSVLDSILGSVASINGVGRNTGYENYTDAVDANGLPPHSISIVAEGGDAQMIGDTINLKKTPGTNTYGTTSVDVVDRKGIPGVINYFVLTKKRIVVEVTIHNLAGYVVTTAAVIKQAVADYINGLSIGEDVLYKKLYGPADLTGNPLTKTFNVTLIKISISPAVPAEADIAIDFNATAECDVADITVTVV